MVTNRGVRTYQFYDPASGGGGIVSELLAGEVFDVTGNGAPFAAYPKVKKRLTIGPTNNILSTSAGNITLPTGTHIYPYTALKTSMETQLNALPSALVFAVEIEEKNTKISADAAFTIDKLVANSAALTLGYDTLDTSIAAEFFRADAVRQFTNGIYLFKVNTDDDSNPPILASDETTPVAANHRARSFSGYVVADALAIGDEVDILTSGEIEGWTGLTLAADYFTNGTAGQISTTSVTNSLEAGKAASTEKLVLDATDKGFEFQIEPDTDFKANTTDGVRGWESLPEIPLLFETSNLALSGLGVDGDNLVTMQVSTANEGPGMIGFSTDRGKNWRMATLDNLPAGHQFNHNTLRTRNVASPWGNSANDFQSFSPSIVVKGDQVFIAFAFWDSGIARVKGLHGTIDSNGDLELRLTNEYSGGVYNTLITPSSSGISRYGIRAIERNGMIYVLNGVGSSSQDLRVNISHDFGAVFTSTEEVVKNSGTTMTRSTPNFSDFQPYRAAVVDVPGQTIDPSDIAVNGDFGTGDFTGWTNTPGGGGNSSTWTVNANNQAVRSAGNGVGVIATLDQTFTTIAGRAYEIAFDVIEDNGDAMFTVVRNTNVGGADISPVLRSAGKGKRTLVFQAASATSFLYINGASNSAPSVTLDNFTIKEVPLNRLAVNSPCNAGGVANCFNNLFYTDNFDISANWATALDVGELLGFTYHLMIGDYLASDDKWYVHAIAGHASANAAGGTARVGSTTLSQISEIDLSTPTPTIQAGTIAWQPGGAGNTPNVANGGGTNNSNGTFFFQDTTNVFKDSDGDVWAAVTNDSGGSFIAKITDMSNVASSTQINVLNPYQNDDIGGNSLISEMHFGTTGSDLHVIYKRHFGSFGTGESLGRMESQELTKISSASSTPIVEDDFTNPNLDTRWTVGGTVGFNGSNMQLNNVAGTFAARAFTTVVDRLYYIEFRVSANNGDDGTLVGLYDGSELVADPTVAPISSLVLNAGADHKRLYFTAQSTTSTLHFKKLSLSNTQNIDDLKIEEAMFSIDDPKDLANKPNIDEDGFCGHVRAISDGSTIHAFAEKDFRADENGNREVGIYNNFGLKTIEVEHRWDKFPTEYKDAQSNHVTGHDLAVSADGTKRVQINYESGVTDRIFVRTSADSGTTWSTTEITPPAAVFNPGIGVDQFHRHSPKAWCDDTGRVFVAFLDTNLDVFGYYGTMNAVGETNFDISNDGVGGNRVLADTQSYQGIQLGFNNGKLYVCARVETVNTGQIWVSYSTDFGATFSSNGVAGTSTNVKTDGSGCVSTGSSLIRLWVVDDPNGGATDNRLIFHYVRNSGGDGVVAWVDENGRGGDLTQSGGGNWETEIPISGNSGTNGEFVIADGISPDGTKLATLCGNSNSTTQIRFNILNIQAPTMTATQGSTGTDISPGPVTNYYNGHASATNSGYLFRHISQRIAWHSNNQTCYIVYSTEAGGNPAGAGRFIKIPDVASPGTNISAEYILGQANHAVANESIFNIGGDVFMMVYNRLLNDPNDWTDRGSIQFMKMTDDSPTTNTLPSFSRLDDDALTTNQQRGISGDTSSGAPRTGTLLVRQSALGLHAQFSKANDIGAFGVFSNDYQEKAKNEEVVEFSQIPTNLTYSGSDTFLHNFAAHGNKVISFARGTGIPTFNISIDGGITHKRQHISGVSPLSSNNTPGNGSFATANYGAAMSPTGHFVIAYQRDVTVSRTYCDFGHVDDEGQLTSYGQSNSFAHVINGTGNTLYNRQVEYRDGKFYVSSVQTSTNRGKVAVSSDNGATFATEITVGDGGGEAEFYSGAPYKMFITDNGSGGNRINFLALDPVSFDLMLYYSDDDGATWETAITVMPDIGANWMVLYGFGISPDGTKVAALVQRNNAGDNLYLTVCEDITAATPSWTAATEINVANGAYENMDKFTGNSSSSNDLFYSMNNLARIAWFDNSSFACTWAAATPGAADMATRYAVVSDLVTPSNGIVVGQMYGPDEIFASDEATENAILKDEDGNIFGLSKLVNTSITNNLAHGRLLARQIYPDGSIGPIRDIGYKREIAVGGYLGRPIVKGKYVMFQKEDGSSIEQAYFNAATARKTQKGSGN